MPVFGVAGQKSLPVVDPSPSSSTGTSFPREVDDDSSRQLAPPQQQRHPMLLRLVAQSNDIGGSVENYPTGCAFSPDGTCVLTATSSDGVIRLYDTPFGYLAPNHGALDGDNDEGEIAEECAAVHLVQQGQAGGGCSHNQNHHRHTAATPTKISTTASKERHHHAWTASLSSRLGGAPPPSSFASYAWYPHMNSSDPSTSFYISCRGHSSPIHLIDAYDSQLRASYRPYNGVDEMEGPTVVAFCPDGSKVYGTGFRSDRTIAVFDTSIPGREGLIARLGRTRRSKDGQKGIPSSIAFPTNKGGGSFSPNVFAVGSYSPASIYIYDNRMSSCIPGGTIVLHGGLAVVGHGRAFSRKKRRFAGAGVGSDGSGGGGGGGGALGGDNRNNIDDDDDGDENSIFNLFSSARVNWFQSRARGGVTQLLWAPSGANNPYALFSASRRSNMVLSWDLRALSGNEGKTRSRPICGLRSYAREDGDTNQRLQFDIDSCGKQLFVASGGGGGGVVKIYDVESGRLTGTLSAGNNDGHAVNGVSYFHRCSDSGVGDKFTGLLAVAVGSRQFRDVPSDDEEERKIASSTQKECPGSLQLYRISRE